MFRKTRFLAITLTTVAMAAQTARAEAARSERVRATPVANVQTVTPGAQVSINPQPLPPRVGPGSRVAINPQPLPPKQ